MKFRKIFYLLMIVFFLYGCQNNPDSAAVISKNDGTFDIKIIQNATVPLNYSDYWQYDEKFYSTDRSVEYTLDLFVNSEYQPMPIVKVEPYFLTGSDAQRIAKVLFNETPIYISKQRLDNVIFSKDEILEKIQRWSTYTNPESISNLYGSSREETIQIVCKFIEEFNKLLETAPTESQNMLCTWDFKKESFYSLSQEEIDRRGTEQDNDAIKTELDIGEVHYAYNVVRRDKEDFSMSRISAYLYGGVSPDNIDERIFTSILCRTDKPTKEQVDVIKKKAEQMLIDMRLGSWEVDQCYVETNWRGNTAEYIIHITAVPVFEGVSSVRRPQLDTLHSKASYASNYYLTDASFEFAADGSLVSFELNSPVQVIDVINQNVATLCMDELIERAKNHLSLYDYGEYGLSIKDVQDNEAYFGESIQCRVYISKMDYGLSRVKVPNSNNSYYYVPSLALYGTVDYYGKDSGSIYFSSGELLSENRIIPLILLNAIDGSIIELRNS